VRLFRHQVRNEQLIFWRSREAAFFVFIFPLLLFVLLSSVYTHGLFQGKPGSWAVLAGIIGYGAANTGFAGLALLLVARREMGFLKRIRSTPLPATSYLSAVVTSILVVFLLQCVALFILGKLLKHTPFPDRPVSFFFALLLGAGAFAAMGIGFTTVVRSAEGSSAAVNVVLLPMAFLSGGFGPTEHYPKVLQAIADVLPMKYFIEIVYAIYLHGERLWSKPGAIAVLAAWGIAGAIVALRRFRWEPVEG
jgi:ABC-2 type transport system permease protein